MSQWGEIAGRHSDSTHNQQLQPSQSRPQRISKTAMTLNYTEQLAPLYPALTKTQVRAALVLTNNDLHECRLLLDMKSDFVELKKSFRMPSHFRKIGWNRWNDVGFSFRGKKTPENARKSRGGVRRCQEMKPFQISRRVNVKKEDGGGNEVIPSFCDLSSGCATCPSCNGKFKGTGSSPLTENQKEWLENMQKRGTPKKKVGIVIVRDQTGYKVAPL
nr:uncharacterized protein LOC111517163 [Leptinotarsa decemlineata]